VLSKLSMRFEAMALAFCTRWLSVGTQMSMRPVLRMLQLGGGQQPVNDQLPTGLPTSQQAVQPADQLGTQKPAVTVQNVPATIAANRLGFTDRDTLPPVSLPCSKWTLADKLSTEYT
jgi:hypothetical protein